MAYNWAHFPMTVRVEHLRSRFTPRRPPDEVIGGIENPYMLRWCVLPKNRWFNFYIHLMLRSDDDRAYHDHPWPSLSFMMQGWYWEDFPDLPSKRYSAGDAIFREAKHAHMLRMYEPVVTWFFTGPRVRDWGFILFDGSWMPWREFEERNEKHDQTV